MVRLTVFTERLDITIVNDWGVKQHSNKPLVKTSNSFIKTLYTSHELLLCFDI